MSLKFVLLVLVAATFDSFNTLKLAKPCNEDTCKLPDCRCLSTDIPGGYQVSEIPQLVLLTFDDAVTPTNFEMYREAFFDRKNPDGCKIQTTYFMNHEYTDYSKVHELHAHGHEIALHSTTHKADQSYWDDLSLEGHLAEFGDGRDIAAHFAKIPSDDFHGLRVPFLRLGGNNSFEAIQKLGLTYDASWPTLTFMDPSLWPYSLDYASSQDCPIGVCPTASLPGVWVQPMVNWSDDEGYICSMVDACIFIPTDVDGLFDFMVRNFKRHYEGNKAPFGFYVHSAWFMIPARFEAYLKFLDYIQSFNDVYIVGVQKSIEWTKNPTPTSQLNSLWPDCPRTYEPNCRPLSCELRKGEELRYMTHCQSSCPKQYPWLGNPLGK